MTNSSKPQRPNTGVLFKNTRKEKDTQPDLRGVVNAGGITYDLAAWKKMDKNGNPFYSLSVKTQMVQEHEEKQEQDAII